MGLIESRWVSSLTRRRALLALSGMLAGLPGRLRAQLDPRDLREHRRVPGLDEMVDVFDFEPICFANVPQHLYDFTARATGSEWTKRRNRHVFDWVELVERPGVSPTTVDASTELFGIRLSHPILIAPNSNHGHMHPSGEIGTYQGATAAGAIMTIANGPTIPHEEVSAAADGPLWMQLYANPDLEVSRRALERFQNAGAQAIIITIDQSTASQFDRALHGRWLGGNPPPPSTGNQQAAIPVTSLRGVARYRVPLGRLWLNWDFLERLQEFVEVPILIKGILTPEDARIVIERGFDGIVVSNHGARALDYAPSTLEVLPGIVDAVDGRIPVLVDSGFRRGSDVFKALALGADGVCLGRATRWGLGAFGPAGVQRVLEIMQAELRETMVRTGRATLAAVDRTAVRTHFP